MPSQELLTLPRHRYAKVCHAKLLPLPVPQSDINDIVMLGCLCYYSIHSKLFSFFPLSLEGMYPT